ncbi:MAG: ABC-type transport auxiliary lipoprotein family protein [Pseudomonadota bacterium]
MIPGRLLPVVLALLTLGACLGGKVPATTYYRLKVFWACQPRERPFPYVLAVMPLRANEPYQTDRMLYMPSAYEVASYANSKWEAAPADMLGQYLQGYLEKCRLFQAVTARGISDHADLVLRGTVTRFEEATDAPGPAAVLGLSADVSCLATSGRVWRGELTARTNMSARTPEELARAMSVSLEKVLGELQLRLVPVLEGLRDKAECPNPAP